MTDADRTDAVDPVDPNGDDWAPLPEEKRILHPGELVEAEPEPQGGPLDGPALAIPSVYAPQAVAAQPDPAADPAADPAGDPAADPERAVAELKARIAAAAPAQSFVAEVVHRQERKERQQRAATAVRAAEAAVMKRGKRPRAPLPIEYDPGVHGRDPREEEEWYKALPAAERERLQAAWTQKRLQAVSDTAVHRRNRNRRFFAALIAFAAVLITGTGIQWAATVGAGICCGIWWRHAVPDRFLDPLRALACFYGMHMIAMAADGALVSLLFMDAILLVGFGTIVGFDGEMRRTGGFDSK